MSKSSASVVLPAYNEEAILERTATTLVDELRRKEVSFEIVIVENGSTDATANIANDLQQQISEIRAFVEPRADYGAALRTGFRSSENEFVINFDCDYYNVDFLVAAIAKFEENPNLAVIVGSKRAPGSDDTRAWHRRLVTVVFSTLLRKVFGLHRSDTHGMKAMRREMVAPYVEQCQLTRELFDTELILRVERAGLPTDEIPVAVLEQRPARSSIVSRIPRTLRGLTQLWFVLKKIPPASSGNSAEEKAA
jgi:glycosyltransferase involved in cell wall biosynthesis